MAYKYIIQNEHGDVVDIVLDSSKEEALSLWNNPEGWTATEVELTQAEKEKLGQMYSKNIMVKSIL